ncbi:hypothetical protein LTR15_005687 [Elasticomyces elasticus]|nr:hypothetical protein LTR15_005687 [Elasticomyces elasticus]
MTRAQKALFDQSPNPPSVPEEQIPEKDRVRCTCIVQANIDESAARGQAMGGSPVLLSLTHLEGSGSNLDGEEQVLEATQDPLQMIPIRKRRRSPTDDDVQEVVISGGSKPIRLVKIGEVGRTEGGEICGKGSSAFTRSMG